MLLHLLQSWEPDYSRLVYTILCFTIQYLAPSLTVLLVYTRWVARMVPMVPMAPMSAVCRVCQKLTWQSNLPLSSHRRSRQMERRKKTNRMLITVTIIFFVSWAPLNLFNILIEILEPFDQTEQGDMLAMFGMYGTINGERCIFSYGH